MLTNRFRSLASLTLSLLVTAGGSVALAAPDDSAASTATAPVADSASTAAASPVAAAAPDDDAVLQPAEPDFRVVNLPTTLRLPKGKGNFTLTHRFAGNLRRGSFSDQAGHLFGIDEGATVGFEYRYGVARHLEAVVYRTSFSRTVQFSAKYDVVHQSGSTPLSLSAVVSAEGINNFQDQHAPAVGVTVSRTFADTVAVYAVPMWVHNSAAATGTDRDTTYLGVGGRVRIRPTVYLAVEGSPRLSGYAPGTSEFGFAIEKRAGGHVFQLNFTNTAGSTYAQVARGASPHSLSLGFNLTRKFF